MKMGCMGGTLEEEEGRTHMVAGDMVEEELGKIG
jgi:hypothetical protein